RRSRPGPTPDPPNATPPGWRFPFRTGLANDSGMTNAPPMTNEEKTASVFLSSLEGIGGSFVIPGVAPGRRLRLAVQSGPVTITAPREENHARHPGQPAGVLCRREHGHREPGEGPGAVRPADPRLPRERP